MIYILNEVMTAIEASKLWGKDPSTVKKACQRGSFTKEEYNKSGDIWLVTLSGMERLYGKQPQKAPGD